MTQFTHKQSMYASEHWVTRIISLHGNPAADIGIAVPPAIGKSHRRAYSQKEIVVLTLQHRSTQFLKIFHKWISRYWDVGFDKWHSKGAGPDVPFSELSRLPVAKPEIEKLKQSRLVGFDLWERRPVNTICKVCNFKVHLLNCCHQLIRLSFSTTDR